LDSDGNTIDKGLQTVGAERDRWDKDRVVTGQDKALTLDEMRDILRKDPDFAVCLTILERTFETFPLEMQELPWLRDCPALEFSVSYLAKFWCSLAWIEQVRFNFPFTISFYIIFNVSILAQYWADVKAVTRQQCDYTITGLKAVFPVALATACPPIRIRNYMQRSLDHVAALMELGRHADFSQIPSLRKKYKSHRRSELIRLGLCDEKVARKRNSWGKVIHSRLKSPTVDATTLTADESHMVDEEEQEFGMYSSDEDDEDVLPSAAVACAQAMIAVAADVADEEISEIAASE